MRAEIADLRAKLAAAERERDDAMKWTSRAEAENRAVMRALGDWLLVPPDGGSLGLAEGVERIKAELAETAKARDEAESFCYRAAKAKGNRDFVCAETVPLRATIAAQSAALAKARNDMQRVLRWLQDDRLGQWTYMEGGYFYDDLRQRADELRAALAAIDALGGLQP